MSLFGSTANSFQRPTGGLFGTATSSPASTLNTTATDPANPMKDFEVGQPPDDTVQMMKFSPAAQVGQSQLLATGSWDNQVRVYEIKSDGKSEGKALQSLNGPVLALDWNQEGTQLFVACADGKAYAWDLASNQIVGCGQHTAPIKTCHYVTCNEYTVLITGSWDKTLKVWNLRQQQQTPILDLNVGERVYAADCIYPMYVVAIANKHCKTFDLTSGAKELRDIESPLKFQSRTVSIFKNKTTNQPIGFAIGSTEGRVGIQYLDPPNPKDNFTFKAHRSPDLINGYQEIYVVNQVLFHPVHGTLATVGSDGRYSFWDKDARTKLKTSEAMQQPITCCAFNPSGDIFAYAVGYDWSKGHEYNNPAQKPRIFLHPVAQEMLPRGSNKK